MSITNHITKEITMPIELESPTTTRTPVLRRRQIGETFTGALVKHQQRDVLKDDKPVLKANGKPRQELVVTLVALPGATMPAGLGDEEAAPQPGDIVRLILKGGGYGEWIEADKALKPRQVGDIVTVTSDYAQAYNADGTPTAGKITDQAEINTLKARGRTVGIYGSLTITRPTPAEAPYVQQAEAEYMAASATPLPDPGEYV